MSAYTILTVIGARPQFVKLAAFHQELLMHEDVEHFIVHTGQHYDDNMSNIFFRELAIPSPNINLGIGGGTHGQNTGRMIEQIEEVLLDVKPSWVVVFGDTDSTLAAALAAVKLHIPVAHIEAGLRSFNRKMPEEINRILTDHSSDVLFVPSKGAARNLEKEGIPNDKVRWSGDIMYDVALMFRERISNSGQGIEKWGATPQGYVLATIHRAENTDTAEQLSEVMDRLSEVNHKIIFPLHPRTKNALSKFQIHLPDNVRAISPVGYVEMVLLETNALFIITDSGGVQKEAYFHQVPCITMREETEWSELVEHGFNYVVGTNVDKMRKALREIENRDFLFDQKFYGDGNAAQLIVKALLETP
ncbi:MAG: non-hydrolyzing UDP-N-acetylglucosamine 2-epimerase [Lewinella sp.]|uniref:non-hydrolyzing UDP-N-acetylglucosamine 2-epimerase n=1 Tax=Lewinella sp. TaxID=2004506 RepID=UPI003D6BF4A6